MSIDNLPPLREVIERHDLMPKKSLGQNFLFDLNLTSKIARQAGNLQDQPVIEVGPGPGGLTRALLAQGAYVTAIERDERCLDALAEIEAHYPGRLRIISGDALEQDFSALFPEGPKPRIVANLPYNVGTQLLLNWLLVEPWPPFYSSMTLMFQREVAERIVATPDTDHYGRLGVLAGWRTVSKISFDVPPQAFTPPPKVMSSVVHIIPREVREQRTVIKLKLHIGMGQPETAQATVQPLCPEGGRHADPQEIVSAAGTQRFNGLGDAFKCLSESGGKALPFWR